ncbi:MAG: glycoside hydrolase family 57 protein [Candidatus Woesearchaeota archaeon]
MANICFYFQVHQPYRVRKYSVFDIDNCHNYFDLEKNKEVLLKVAKKSYLPTNELMLSLINRHEGKFKIAYSISGVALEQFEEYCPEVIQSFKDLVNTGCVELLSETYYHSLAWLQSREEFKEQVLMHKKKLKELFNYTPQVFRNTELTYNNELALFVEKMGYKGILAEGADHVLGWRSPNYVYNPVNSKGISLLLKNYKLADDIAFRFSNKGWKEWPLTAEKYASWVNSAEGVTVNLFMDYETFGEHQWEDTGIFNFMDKLPEELIKRNIGFMTPSETIKRYKPIAELDIPHIVSWADLERDLSAWLGNRMQRFAFEKVYKLKQSILKSKDRELIGVWRKLQTSDHFYYMCTKWFADGDVHKYFNPYESPYDSFIYYMNALNDLENRTKKE